MFNDLRRRVDALEAHSPVGGVLLVALCRGGESNEQALKRTVEEWTEANGHPPDIGRVLYVHFVAGASQQTAGVV